MALLVASLAAALVIYLYDSYVSGPPVARLMLATIPAGLSLLAFGYGEPVSDVPWVLAATFLGLVEVAFLQWLQVARDAAMTSVMRRR